MLNVSGVLLLEFCDLSLLFVDSEHMQLNVTAYMLDSSDYRSMKSLKFEVNCWVECRSTSWLISVSFSLPMLPICYKC